MSISRRDFFKGAAGTAVLGAAGMALAGCSTASEPTKAPAEAAPAATTPSESLAATGVGAHTWEVKPAPITDIAETKEFDIVIVGAGIAGNAAAEAAARNGVKVAVLEQAGEFTVHGVDCGHIGSKFQAENGIEINPYEATKLLYRWSQQTANRNLILTWALRSGKVFDYLDELCRPYGVQAVKAFSPTAKWDWQELDELYREYTDAVTFSEVGQDVGLNTKDGKMVNYHIISILNQEAEKKGAEFFYNTRAEQLVGDAASGISGVIAQDADGKHIEFKASKGVILATGDISGNQEMVDVWAPICNRADMCAYSPMGGNNGDGITMAMWAGAAHQTGPAAPMVHPVDLSPDTVFPAISMCWLSVNTLGQRYGNEMPFEPTVTNGRMSQPGNVCWNVFDSDYEKYAKQQFPDTYQALCDGAAEKLAGNVEKGTTLRGDTLEELAAAMGVPADTFVATVERYNQLSDQGEDVDFGVPARFLAPLKTGPFYAQTIPAITLVCIFGLHVNDDSQVLTADDKPIEGLFAVGNAQGDFFANSYPVHCPGISHGRALTFGQLVGDALAKDTVITKL